MSISQNEWKQLKNVFPFIQIGNRKLNLKSYMTDNCIYCYLYSDNYCTMIVNKNDIKYVVFNGTRAPGGLATVILKTNDERLKNKKELCPDFRS